MNVASAVQSGASVQMREAVPADAFERGPGVQEGHQARPGAREVRRQQERVVLADDAVDGVRRVGPVDEDADQRVVDRAQLGDRLVRAGQITLDHIRRSAQFLERGRELRRWPRATGAGPTRSAWPDSRRARRWRLFSTWEISR